jgi:hypothetical protein
MSLILVCSETNDLCAALSGSRIPFTRHDSPEDALESAADGDGLLLLADGYPDARTRLLPEALGTAAGRSLRLFIEYPDALPTDSLDKVRLPGWGRVVVSSDVFGPTLGLHRILMAHDCRILEAEAPDPLLVSARVAGFDRAVYGLPEDSVPILYEASPDLLVATTKLSQFVTGRYAPPEAWRAVWNWILTWADPSDRKLELTWTPVVRPSYASEADLADDAEEHAVDRSLAWYRNARLFVHPGWEGEAERRLKELPDGTGIGPDADWPVGDGSCGMIEGASSTIHPDGSQNWRYYLRNDCIGEASAAMALGGKLADDANARQVAANLNDFIYRHSCFAQGPRSDPASPSFGLLSWHTLPPGDGVYYGDDNARSILGTMVAAAVLDEGRWDAQLLRCILANLRTAGPLGFRNGRLGEEELQEKGWRHFHDLERTHIAPHYESWLWACYLWAYRHTGYKPLLDKAATAIRITMDAYPEEWRWTNGIQQERARMLLPLAWLVRVDPSDQHRTWLRTMASELLAGQAPCGAIGEEVGSLGQGKYAPPATNEAYGTSEAPLIHENGNPLCDLLYTTNFALVGLHEAAAATQDPVYSDAEDRLAEFLCRIQARSESRPELDGAWFRAFDFGRWDFWASNADAGWGAWSVEAGWTQGWVTSVLAMRQLGTSHWDLTADSRIADHADSVIAEMLPDR